MPLGHNTKTIQLITVQAPPYWIRPYHTTVPSNSNPSPGPEPVLDNNPTGPKLSCAVPHSVPGILDLIRIPDK